jgi:membrane fusion protein (multidrug efflux system)
MKEDPGDDGAAAANARSRWWSHVIRRGVPIAVLVIGLFIAYRYWGGGSRSGGAGQANPRQQQGQMAVQTVVARAQMVPLSPRFLGQTEASQTVQIRARVRGFLMERAFEEGQPVKAGKVLFRIDPRSFTAELEVARARLEGAQARLDRAVVELKRLEELVANQAANQVELENARKEERVTAAEVHLEEARLQQAQLELDYTSVESPLDGVVGQALKDVGSYVDETSSGLLAVVQQVDPIYVRYSVSEGELLRWQRLQESGAVNVPKVEELELEITLGDGRAYGHGGRINFVDVQVEPSTGTAVVRGTVPNPEGALLPGQFVHATVKGIERMNTVMVPQRAVLQTPSGPSIYVVNEQNTVESRPVTLGDWVGSGWIVEKGVTPGERIVADRLMMVRPGMAVAATDVKPPQPAPAPRAADAAGEQTQQPGLSARR